MDPTFIHLRVHTEYSIVDGIVRVKPLIKAVADGQMPAVAITDQSNLFAAIKFYKAACNSGIKPLLGVDTWVANAIHPDKPYRLTLLCQNSIGYKNLTRLISRSYCEGQMHGMAILQKSWFIDHSEGLIALSGAMLGDVGKFLLADNHSDAKKSAIEWASLFPDRYYFEVQRIGCEQEETYIQAVVSLASDLDLPIVATNAVLFLNPDDFEAHEARVCIHGAYVLEDSRRPRQYTEQQYLRTAQEMQALFSDLPEALQNSVEIAKRCNLELELGKNYLPNFPIPEDKSLADYFAERATTGLKLRLDYLIDKQDAEYSSKQKVFFDRLEQELAVISGMGFEGYFLIVADFIQWAKENDVPVGPGRGSGPGSLVAYALQITDINPLAYDLLFERFLNPERVSMPDFDVDFCMDGRDRVIEYVARCYGRESVSQIITYGTMAAKAVVRDVGRVLNHPYGFVDKIAKLIPFELGITLDKALAQEEELKRRYTEEEDVKYLIDLAKKLEGITRNAGKHAGGVVIAPTVLTEFTPLYCENNGDNLVTQFDKDDVEAVGLVKFDFLGLRTLTIIHWALQMIAQKRQQNAESPLDISRIDLADPKTFELLKRCATTAVFQLESRGMKDLIKRLQPDCFEELIALVALFRPGPLQSGMVDDFINRKHKRAKVEYPHPDLELVLKPTYGIILYQEQVMQIAQVLAGYTLGGADLLRRAMGKKKPEEMAKQREIFNKGAKARGITEEVANYIFDLMEKFAGYGFNKSHSAAYALISYQTAWLKAHYPAEFMAAVLSSDMDNTDKVVGFIEECRSMGLTILPPTVNTCQYQFTVKDDATLWYGLGAIKGAGEAAISQIILEREQNGLYTNLYEFCRRNDLRKCNKRVLEALIKSGAFDCFAMNRASLMANLTGAIQAAEQALASDMQGQHDLLSQIDVGSLQPAFLNVKDWSIEQVLLGERETLGYFVSGHPLQKYSDEVRQFCTGAITSLQNIREKMVILAGRIVNIRTMFTKRGDRMAFVQLEDQTGRLEVTLFADVYNNARVLLNKDQIIVVEGEVGMDEYSGGIRMSCRKVYSMAQAREIFAKNLLICLNGHTSSLLNDLTQVLMPHKSGSCPVVVQYTNQQAKANLLLGSEWQIKPSDELLFALRELCGEQNVQLSY